ncbi:unnamed protein product [Aphanomyces euteiches]|uniref:Nuclear pore complex protein Nup85 n=1 Tax=Aphanomyces euteiches TaxID=100861 RepID=A0A6G0WRA7_9STRA|nr:hypothetical protein Ae201684_012598 [Aphanomyces euteiches]KAH9155896.1 hypothetical protein AeRB84_002174 [Aphanomyces euteiches]
MGMPTRMEIDAGSAAPLDKSLTNLIAESTSVFERLMRESDPVSVQTACRAYRASMLKCVREMDKEENLLEVIKASMALLHLCEILLFSDSASTVVPYEFAAWMQEHYGAIEVEELDAAFFDLQNHISLETQTTYWPTVIQLVMCGNGRKAWELLSRTVALHGRHAQSLETLRHLLLNMPSTYSDKAFNWAAWQDTAQQLLQNDQLVHSDPHIRLVVELLTGQHLEQHARSWHQLVVAQCLLDDPKTHLSAATVGGRLVQRMEAAFPSELPPFEQIVVQLLQYDLIHALESIRSLSAGSFPWFLAHLSDLLVRKRELQPTESFILDFVQSTLIPHSLWPLATLYLEQCPSQGGQVLFALLQDSIPSIDSDFKALKLLDICSTYNLSKTTAAISSRRGDDWYAKQRFGSALTWYIRGNNVDAINRLCDEIIADHPAQLEIAADVLASATSISSPTIEFLVKFHEMQLVLADLAHVESTVPEKVPRVQREAAMRLSALCTHCSVPRHLWQVVWSAMLPLLAVSPPVFASTELYGVLEAMENHRLALTVPQSDENFKDDQELVATVRRGIAVCLSQVLLVEV